MPFEKGNIPWNKGKSSWNRGLTKKTDERIKSPWNKGLTTETDLRIKPSSRSWKKGIIPWNKDLKCPKISETHNGSKNPFYGKKHSGKTKRKMSKAQKGNINGFKKGSTPWNKGLKCPKISESQTGENNSFWNKHHSEEFKRKISLVHLGEKNHNWRGGISFEPYGLEFDNDLKLKTRRRDSFICQLCGDKENGRNLDAHHIDYNKQNNNPENLISLCVPCHRKTNHNREEWTKYFQDLIKVIA